MPEIDNIIKWGGALISGALALMIAWRSRSNREPDLTGVSRFAYNLSIVVVAAILALIIFDEGASLGFASLAALLRSSLVASVVSVFTYIGLSSILVYEAETIENGNSVTKRIVGGFWLTPRAKEEVRAGKTVQDFLLETNYDPDRVWPRPSRGLGLLLVIASYVLLMVGLSTTLAASAVFLGKAADGGGPADRAEVPVVNTA